LLASGDAVNLQHLKHFVAVAEELHFGRAAQRIGMAQPPLSQSIRRLEDSLGCPLFLRTRRKVELTPSGEALLEHARDILAQIDYAQKAVLRAKEAGVSQMTIGFTPNALSESLPAAMQEIRRLAPAITLTLWEGGTGEQIAGILNGQLDVGFFQAASREMRGLEVHVVEETSTVAAVPDTWPLANQASLRMSDLADYPLLMMPAARSPIVHERFMAAFRNAGVKPNIVQEAAFDYTRLKLVAAGMGASLVSSITAPNGYPGVRMLTIEDLPPDSNNGVAMVWRRAAPPPVRRLLLAAANAIRRA
jgi:DNA-binding transcriptional LysR family regulator